MPSAGCRPATQGSGRRSSRQRSMAPNDDRQHSANPLLLAVMTYGRRGMGDQLRYSPSGPRELEETDRREDGRAKVGPEPESQQIRADARFAPIVEPEHHEKLLEILDNRSGTQRGKPRCASLRRIHSAPGSTTCRVAGRCIASVQRQLPLYVRSVSAKPRCEVFAQSRGRRGRFALVLATIRQRLFRPSFANKLEQRLRECAERELASVPSPNDTGRTEAALADVRHQLERVTQNMAFAEGEEQYKARRRCLHQSEATGKRHWRPSRRPCTGNRQQQGRNRDRNRQCDEDLASSA